MTEFIIRLFVKDYKDTQDPDVRLRYGSVAGAMGIVCNVFLFIAKLIIGTISRSVSITADAVNNLSDAASSILTLLGFKMSQKPADKEHPYGHARMEYLSGMAVSALILVIGYELAKTSFQKIINPQEVDFSVEIIIVLAVSILVKLWMMYFNTKVGKRIDSPTLAATAADSRNDVITTSAVLVAAVIAHISGLNLDGIIGFLVALFILYSGIGIARDTINPLLGEPASEELTKLVYDETLKSDKRVLGVHDLMVHDYGPGQRFASEHVEVDAKEDVLAAHEMIDEIERMFEEKHKIHMVIHYDPVVTDDDEVNEMKEYVESHLADIDGQLKLHDFRIVRSKERTKLIFDLAIPFDFKGKEDELQKSLDKIVASKDKKYCTVITFDLV